MSFLEKIGKAGKAIAEGSRKMINRAEIESKKRKEIRIVKMTALSKLSKSELVTLYKSANTSEVLIANLADEKPPNPNRMPTNELIDKISNNVNSEKICDFLIRTRRLEQANKLKLEIDEINKRFDAQVAEVYGKKVSENSEIEQNFVNEVISYLRNLNFDINSNNDESEYQAQTKMFLDATCLGLKNKFERYGMDVNVRREVPISSDTNEKIDLLLSIGKFKIGIEMKKSLDSTSTSQRLLGQIDRYIDLCDALIVLIVMNEYDSVSVKKILDKSRQTGKIIKVVTHEKIF